MSLTALTPVLKHKYQEPKMSLTSLPPELIDKVLSDKDLRKHDLANLARVNRSFYLLVLNRLYRDVRLYGSGLRQDQEILDLFDRALIASPRLAAATRSLAINAFLPDDDKILRSKSILGKLNALQTLSLAFHGKGYINASFVQNIMPTELDTGVITLTKLQDIEIIDPELTFGEILKLICLPTIGRLAVKCHRRKETSEVAVLSTARHHSSLKSLTLTISADCYHGLRQVLSVCSALESFTCNISSMHNINDDPVSPTELSRALMFCQETLVMMEFSSNKLGHIDDSSLELSQFNNVRSLKANSLLLFGEDERDDPAFRNGLYARLPSSLKILEVYILEYGEYNSRFRYHILTY